jgi:3',5'-cyclic AMP phosphodiesterase CpdA
MMRANPPDRIVHSGDVSFDGAYDEDDLAFARAEKDRLPVPWVAIPGNHDIGESPLAIRLQQPINAERMERWRRHFGPPMVP